MASTPTTTAVANAVMRNRIDVVRVGSSAIFHQAVAGATDRLDCVASVRLVDE
jgi:hypothetical protein